MRTIVVAVIVGISSLTISQAFAGDGTLRTGWSPRSGTVVTLPGGYGHNPRPSPQVIYIQPSAPAGAPPTMAPPLPPAPAVPASYGSAPQVSESADIADIQAQLTARGYYAGPITGQLDNYTRTAISVYQRDVRLAVTGMPDRATQYMLHYGPNVRATIAPIAPPPRTALQSSPVVPTEVPRTVVTPSVVPSFPAPPPPARPSAAHEPSFAPPPPSAGLAPSFAPPPPAPSLSPTTLAPQPEPVAKLPPPAEEKLAPPSRLPQGSPSAANEPPTPQAAPQPQVEHAPLEQAPSEQAPIDAAPPVPKPRPSLPSSGLST